MPVGRQLNLRLDPRDNETLEALAYVRRTSEAALVREIVLEYLAARAHEPGVQEALDARRKRDQAMATSQGMRKLRRIDGRADATA